EGGEQGLQGGGGEAWTNAEHALAGQEDLQASLLGRVHLGRAVGTDVDGHEDGAGGSRGGDVASRGGSRSVAFGEDAAPGIEQGSRKPVGPTKGVHGLPARLPALQELPPVLLLGGVASPVHHGWSPQATAILPHSARRNSPDAYIFFHGAGSTRRICCRTHSIRVGDQEGGQNPIHQPSAGADPMGGHCCRKARVRPGHEAATARRLTGRIARSTNWSPREPAIKSAHSAPSS